MLGGVVINQRSGGCDRSHSESLARLKCASVSLARFMCTHRAIIMAWWVYVFYHKSAYPRYLGRLRKRQRTHICRGPLPTTDACKAWCSEFFEGMPEWQLRALYAKCYPRRRRKYERRSL